LNFSRRRNKTRAASVKRLTTVFSGFSKLRLGWTQPVLIACNEKHQMNHDELSMFAVKLIKSY
jgi:hypothetical protein